MTGREGLQGCGERWQGGHKPFKPATGRLSLLRFIGTPGAGPCTSLSASLSLSPSWCTRCFPARLIYSCTSFLKADRQRSLVKTALRDVDEGCALSAYWCCYVFISAALSWLEMFSFFFDFIRDLYKCLAFWGRDRQTRGRTGQFQTGWDLQ